MTNEPRINDRIRAREVRLIGADGSQIGIKPLPEALSIARELELDLVEVADKAIPPVCRIMDYGKYKYEAAQRPRNPRKSTNVVVKEMKYRPKIGTADFDTKTRKVEQFLGEGHKVKVTIMFRGREMYHPELGRRILDQVAEPWSHVGRVEVFPQARRPQHDDGPGPGQEGAGRAHGAAAQGGHAGRRWSVRRRRLSRRLRAMGRDPPVRPRLVRPRPDATDVGNGRGSTQPPPDRRRTGPRPTAATGRRVGTGQLVA